MAAKPDLSFIKSDIEAQRQAAQEALDEAAKLDGLIRTTTESAAKEALIQARDKLLKLARDLANNVTVTADSANSAIRTLTSAW